MESLNSYISDCESDSSVSNAVLKKSSMTAEEIDANCEPITMDMSEDSSSSLSDGNRNNKVQKSEPKRCYSRSLSPSPPTSFTSDDSSSSCKKKSKNDEKDRRKRSYSPTERSKIDFMKDRRYDDNRHRKDKRDEDRDRRSRDRDRHRDRDSDRYSRRPERKRSHRSRSRSSSYSRHKSTKRKFRSRSRSCSYERHRKRSAERIRHRHHSPYKCKKSRSKSRSREKTKPYDWKSSSKLKVLEKLGIELKVPVGGIDVSQSGVVSQLTPQLLLQKTMEEQVEKVKSATGIQLPSYYNPIAVNPTKYAEQIQKRRLLWGSKDKQPQQTENNTTSETTATTTTTTQTKGTATIWKGATFGGDQDGKMTAKFQRLMGIKNAGAAPATSESKGGSDLIKKQEEMFHSMESQYEVARLATHSHRGLGLGFGTFQPR